MRLGRDVDGPATDGPTVAGTRTPGGRPAAPAARTGMPDPARSAVERAAAAFLGWVTAVGMTMLLGAGAVFVGLALAPMLDLGGSEAEISSDAATLSIVGAVLLTLITLVAFGCGGFVSARVAGVGGTRQGLAVWWWAVGIGVGLILLGPLLGDGLRTGLISSELDVATAGMLAALLVTAALGAALGGRAADRARRPPAPQPGSHRHDRGTP